MIEVPVRVKDALRDGRMLKNYRFNVLNDDSTVDFTIDNNNLVSESVKFDERMCTGNQLKFGLCEGSSLEFQYFDNPNITGRQIQAFIDVQYEDADNELQWYEIPMGFFTVDQCPMQFSTGIRKVTAYNKLRSEYLDQKANEMLLEALNDIDSEFDPNPTIDDVLREALQGFAISNSVDLAPTITIYRHSYTYYDPDTHDLKTGHYCTAAYMSSIKVPVISESYIYQGETWYNSYVVGGIQIRMTGIQTIKNNTPYDPMEQPWGPFHEYITIAYGPTVSEGQRIDGEYRYNIYTSLDEVFLSPYFRNFRAFENQHEPSEGSFEVWFAFSMATEMTEEEFAQFLDENVTVEFTFTPPTELGSLDAATYLANLPDVTFRELQGAVFETECQFGQLNRETDLFNGRELNGTRLLPADNLYPADTLYPMGNSVRANKSMYQKLWTDSQGVQSFRYLIITYKGLDDEQKEVEKTLQRTVNADGTTDYNMSDNWLFKNLVWSDADVGDYADAMVLKMQNITWFPFEMWCAGLPYIETGDELEISNSEGTYTSYVLQRQLNGIQNLQDTFIDGELDIF